MRCEWSAPPGGAVVTTAGGADDHLWPHEGHASQASVASLAGVVDPPSTDYYDYDVFLVLYLIIDFNR